MDNPGSGSRSSHPVVVDDDSAPPAAKRARKEDDDDQDGPPDVLSNLPDEVLLPILSHLSSVDLARVCGVNRRFRDICKDVALQKRLAVGVYRDDDPRPIVSAALEKIDAYKNLEELFLSFTADSVRLACSALEKCPSLGCIGIVDLEKVNPDSLLRTIRSHGKSLRVLKISASISAVGLLHNVQSLSNLTHLELENVTKNVLRAIVDHCKKLKYFHFDGSRGVTEDDMTYYLEGLQGSLEKISIPLIGKSIINITKCLKLREVDLCLGSRRIRKDVARQTLTSIVKLPMLKVLKINYGRGRDIWVDEKNLVEAFTGEKSIEVLSLESLPDKLDDRVLAAIADSCRNSLTSLTISCCRDGITDEGVGKILHECEKLVKLRLAWCYKVMGDAFRNVRTPLKSLEYFASEMDSGVTAAIVDNCCNSLTNLTLHCHRTSDIGVGIILRGCKKLVNLRLHSCKVSGEDFTDVKAPLRSLECHAMEMDDSTLAAISYGCRNSLRSFTLGDCTGTIDEGMATILRECKKLVDLQLFMTVGFKDVRACKVSSEAFKDVRAPLRSLMCSDMVMAAEEREAIKKRLGIDS